MRITRRWLASSAVALLVATHGCGEPGGRAAASGLAPSSFTTPPSPPLPSKPAARRAISIAASWRTTAVVLEDGSAYWMGEIPPRLPAVARPLRIDGLKSTRVIDLAGFDACAVLEKGEVRCWGWNISGSLGIQSTEQCPNGSMRTEDCATRPTTVLGLPPISALARGNSGHRCAVDLRGQTFCWGSNWRGQVGAASSDRCLWAGNSKELAPCSRTPLIVDGIPNAIEVALAGDATCAIANDGSVWCWGGNWAGQLGRGPADNLAHPTPARVGTQVAFTAVTGGDSHFCAIGTNGDIWCWGSDERNQSGGVAEPQRCHPWRCLTGPTRVEGIHDVVMISADGDSTCALSERRDTPESPRRQQLWCWGRDENRSLGVPEEAHEVVDRGYGPLVLLRRPTEVDLPGRVVSLVNGNDHLCVLSDHGVVYCRGESGVGQLGAPPAEPCGRSGTGVCVQGWTEVRIPGG